MPQTALPSYDMHQPDGYVEHLSGLNDRKPVVASENIYNQFGVLLIPKGAPLSPAAAETLSQHRLKRALEQQVTLSHTLTNEEIHQRLLAYLQSRPGHWAVHQANDFDSGLAFCCLQRRLHPLLRQKLTVMAERMPDIFEHSLFTAWGAGLLARELKLTHDQQLNAFLCGLIHDIGLLHLPADRVDLRDEVTPEKVRAMQSHVVIGHRLLKNMQGCDPEVALGVLEHHERCDRTGYPSRKPEQQLGLLGQLVGSADLLHSMTLSREENQALSRFVPHFKIHAQAFGSRIGGAVLRVLRRVEAPLRQRDAKDWIRLNDRVRLLHLQLLEQAGCLGTLRSLQAGLAGQPGAEGLTHVAAAIEDVLTRSGLGSESLSDWLHVPLDLDDQDQLLTLEEADALQYELLWLFKRLGWNLELMLEKGSLDGKSREQLQAFLAQQQRTLAPGWAVFDRAV